MWAHLFDIQWLKWMHQFKHLGFVLFGLEKQMETNNIQNRVSWLIIFKLAIMINNNVMRSIITRTLECMYTRYKVQRRLCLVVCCWRSGNINNIYINRSMKNMAVLTLVLFLIFGFASCSSNPTNLTAFAAYSHIPTGNLLDYSSRNETWLVFQQKVLQLHR